MPVILVWLVGVPTFVAVSLWGVTYMTQYYH
jgi:hypothetical protein